VGDAIIAFHRGEPVAGDADTRALTAAPASSSPLESLNSFLDRPFLDTNERGGAFEPLKKLIRAEPELAQVLASMLALESLFREDADDGTLEQFVVSGQPLTILLLAKTATHWLLTGLPLTLMAPLVGGALGVPFAALGGILSSLVLGTISLSLIGAVGAGLTLASRRGGVLLSLLTLPLAVPVLIFGARATELAIAGDSLTAPLYLLGAVAVLGLTLAPLAAAAAVRISLE
jgi:heme exporter protein B